IRLFQACGLEIGKISVERLSRGEALTRYLKLRHRPLCDGENRHTRTPVEDKNLATFSRLDHGRTYASGSFDVHQNRLRRDVEIPYVMMSGLERPPNFARRYV